MFEIRDCSYFTDVLVPDKKPVELTPSVTEDARGLVGNRFERAYCPCLNFWQAIYKNDC